MEKKKKIVLTIAGSDPSSGSGIQADLKTFTLLNIHGLTVVTCITAQNTKQVKTTYKIPVDIIVKQIDTILEDFKLDLLKTGMLFEKNIIETVAERIKRYNLKPIVDPVMISTSGDVLSAKNYVNALKKYLIPESYIFTPNINEAEIITNTKIKNIEDVKQACSKIYKIGAKNVLIKGGHLTGNESIDILYDGEKYEIFSLPRIKNKQSHGSGCTLSALIAGFLAKGYGPIVAVKKAKFVLWNMISQGYIPGSGADVLNYFPKMVKEIYPNITNEERFKVWLNLNDAVDWLMSIITKDFIPEVGTNIGYALNNAKEHKDICSINGRIVKTKEIPLRCGSLDFGISKHIASIILAAMSFNKQYRCGMNLRYSEENIKKCKKAKFKIGSFDRFLEPDNTKSTMDWGTKYVIKELGYVPDIIYDKGEIGKEPMIRILGYAPKNVVKKANMLFNIP
jgi:hydroxymethylpyrimidine/phosphomethylpyrimidine kinase